MSMSNTTENDTLKALLQGTDPAYRSAANAWLALYTADPGEAGTAITNEATYTGYARVQITKVTAWTDGGSSFANAALVQWPLCSAGTNTISHFAVVTTASGAGQIVYSGALSSSLAVSAGIQPQAAIGALTVTQD
jgi:hypothetical protein